MSSSSSSSSAAATATATAERKYKGVRMRKWDKWVSEIWLPNSRERIWLGSYDTPEKAARAFVCLRGADAVDQAGINFPDSPPAVARCTNDPEEVYTTAVSHASRPLSAGAPPAAAALPWQEAPVVVQAAAYESDVAGRGNAVVLPPAPMHVPAAGSFDWSQSPLYSPTSYDLTMWMMTQGRRRRWRN